MAKLFSFYALILSLILGREHSVESGKMNIKLVSESDDDDDDYGTLYGHEDEENPALSCLLFGSDDACLIQCFMVARIYGFVSTGYCDEHQTCHCHYDKAAIRYSWRRKIHKGAQIFHQIKSNSLSFRSIREIVEDPFKTGEEIKHLLKLVVSPYKYSRMQTRDYSIAALYTTNGVIDQKAIQKIISMQFDKLAARGRDDLYIDLMYRDKFENALETATDATLYNFTFRVRQLNNKTLSGILENFLKEKHVSEIRVELYEQKDLLEIINNIVINEIIKRNDDQYNLLLDYFGSDQFAVIKKHLKSWM